MLFRGRFEKHVRVGVTEAYDEWGGRLIGAVDPQGALSGEEIIYVFPDGHHALVGAFHEGEFVSGRYATLCEPLLEPQGLQAVEGKDIHAPGITEDLLLPKVVLSTISEYVYRDVPTQDCVCMQPLIPDLYEAERVEVRPRTLEPEAEGLFARVQIAAGELCGWRLGPSQSNEAGAELDVPEELASVSKLRVFLGRKSLRKARGEANAESGAFYHPRFGPIKGLRSMRDIAPDEEICFWEEAEEAHAVSSGGGEGNTVAQNAGALEPAAKDSPTNGSGGIERGEVAHDAGTLEAAATCRTEHAAAADHGSRVGAEGDAAVWGAKQPDTASNEPGA